MSDTASLSSDLKAEAGRLGFALVGICPAVAPAGIARLDEWLGRGFAGEMHYLADRRPAYEHPGAVLDGVRSIVMLAMNYRTAEPAEPAPGQGRVSRYAWGTDYHTLIRRRLDELADFLRGACPTRGQGVWSTRRRYWSANSLNWPAWAGSAKTRCCSTARSEAGSFWRPC